MSYVKHTRRLLKQISFLFKCPLYTPRAIPWNAFGSDLTHFFPKQIFFFLFDWFLINNFSFLLKIATFLHFVLPFSGRKNGCCCPFTFVMMCLLFKSLTLLLHYYIVTLLHYCFSILTGLLLILILRHSFEGMNGVLKYNTFPQKFFYFYFCCFFWKRFDKVSKVNIKKIRLFEIFIIQND